MTSSDRRESAIPAAQAKDARQLSRPTRKICTPISLTIADAIATSGIPRTAIYDLIAKGRLRISRVGRRSLIVYADLHRVVTEGIATRQAEVQAAVRNGRMVRAAQTTNRRRSS